MDARPTSTYKWFYDMSKISEITGIEFLNTSEVTDMGRMFHGCSKLSSLNVSGFNTENVTSMFCMFTECSNLTSLDLSSFNTANVKGMSYMFSDCSSLKTIYASGGWITTNVISSTEMFSGCTELQGFAGTAYDSRHVEKEYAHFDGGTANPGYLTPKGSFPYAAYTPSNNTLTFYSDEQMASRSGTAYYLNNGSATPAWSEHSPLIFHVVYDASFDGARPESTCHWFHNLTNLQDITGTQYLHTDYVTDMSYMFSGCRLASLDLSRFNTEKVTNMQNMFASCSELTSLDLSSFNTASVKNMSYMLYGCANLESLDVSSFNTASVTNMNRMFSDCSSLACIDLRSFNTKQVTAMTGMFYSCSALATILAGDDWSTEAVTSHGYMFTNCTSLVGRNGTAYSSSYVDKTYARFDNAPVSPGYLSSDVIDYGLKVGGIDVTNVNAGNIKGTGITAGKVAFNAATHTLTLDGATIGFSSDFGCIYTGNAYAFDDLTVNLVGDNALSSPGSSSYYIMMQLRHNTTFKGSGSLSGWNICKVLGGKSLTIGGGCTLTGAEIIADESTSTLVMNNALTKLELTRNIKGFASVTLNDGLNVSKPVGAYYDTTNKYMVNASGNELTGLTIDNNTDYDYGILVIGKAVKTSNASDVLGDGGSVSYDPDTHVLTLNNATLESNEAAGVATGTYVFDDLTINLVGDNTFNITTYVALPIRCHTIITGTGTLSLGAGWIQTNASGKNLTIEGGCTVSGVSIIGNKSTLTVRGTDTQINLTQMIYSFTSVTLEDGLYFAQPLGGSYDATNQWMVKRNGKQCTDGVIIRKPDPYAVYNDNNSTLTFYCDGQQGAHFTSAETIYNLNEGTAIPGWYTDGNSINTTKVVFDESFAAARPTSTYYWFAEMYDLPGITGIQYLNTSEVTTMASMFWECGSLSAVDVSGFDTHNVTNMSNMFSQCYELTSLDVSGWDTSNVTDMSWIFGSCSKLTALDVSHFNTSNVTSMENMFDGCSGLTSLDLSSFNTANVANMNCMFKSSKALKTIYVGDDWSTTAVNESIDMFNACNSLVGGKGTTYDAGHVDAAYAHIDGGSANPGYLTKKTAFMLGDVNADGMITPADVTALASIILGEDAAATYNREAADMNHDGNITISDVTKLVSILLGE